MDPKTAFQILDISDEIQAAGINKLENLSVHLKDFGHPQIYYELGIAFFIKGDVQSAKKWLIKGASFGKSYPCSIYDHSFVNSIGQCYNILLTQYSLNKIPSITIYKATCLAYIYLSKCIKLHPRTSQDSYRARALLFKDHEAPTIAHRVLLDNLSIGMLIEPFIISDFYFAAMANGSPYRNCLNNAAILHSHLEDVSIAGKDANTYTLKELAEFGEKRHELLFTVAEIKYMNSEYDISNEELDFFK